MMLYGAARGARVAGGMLRAGMMAMVVTGSLAYIVRTIKYSGRAESEVRQAERFNKKLVADNKRLAAINARMDRDEKAAADEVAAAAALAVTRKLAIDEIPRTDEEIICPINCRLPQ